MAVDYLSVTWNSYHTHAYLLARTILSRKIPVDEIVAIARGGLTLGHILSDLLNVPISTFTIQSYTDIKTQGEVTITAPLQTQITGKHILMVDDVSDSGKTLERATAYLQEFSPSSVTVATMFYKPHSIFKPQIYAEETTKWILFPYEPSEMIVLITNGLQKEGKSKEEIHNFLLSLSYTDDQIRYAQNERRSPTL